MKSIITMVLAVSALAVGANQATAAPTRTSCSDLTYLNAAVKAGKKKITALKLSGKHRYSAALVPARTALSLIKHSAQPCDEGTESYWLHRQYEIHYAVALVRYLEEMRDGDEDSADIYWSSVEFWSDEIRDIQLTW